MKFFKRDRERIAATARETFGFESLRPGQREAIDSVLAGNDTLAVFPTGAGKSAIYQIPAVMLDGPTVVISPLIALQKDQVDSLKQHKAGGAALVNSQTHAVERMEAFEELESGDLEFIFVTPEQLAKPDILARIQQAAPSLFVVDEAHCISEWGHDFRPDYLKLGAAVEALGHPRILALTATASEPVRLEIAERLGMHQANVIVKGFDRPNIRLSVETFQTAAEKREGLLRRIGWAEGSGIVYVSSRRNAEELAIAISERGLAAMHYHAGLPARERHFVQDEFMAGRIPVMVATSAFGMGIDKPDIRFVFHYDIPHSLDAYYQEIGRAGRDGAPSEAILFYRAEDMNIHKFFAGGGKVGEEQLARIAAAVHAKDGPVTAKELAEELKLSKTKIAKAIQRLKDAGAVTEDADCRISAAENAPEVAEAAHTGQQENQRRHDAELYRMDQMRAYAEALECRRAHVLRYFGEETTGDCGNCDFCLGKSAAAGSRREVTA